MPTAARLSDKGTQHDGYYETTIIAGSSTVFIDGMPAARQGDPLTPHSKPDHPPHPRKIAGGSATVFIDGNLPPEPAMPLTVAAWLSVAAR